MSFQPELWVERAGAAVEFYEAAFGATVLHRVGEGDDIVAQPGVGDAAFWVASAGPCKKRFSPQAIGGATSRTLLVTDDPDAVLERTVGAGATETSPVADEHGRRLGRIVIGSVTRVTLARRPLRGGGCEPPASWDQRR